MQFKQRRELKRTRIEIIPMIDTIFFLLVFFMLSSLALTRLHGLPVNLPHAATAPTQPPTELTLTMVRSRRLYVDKEPIALDNLQAKLVEKTGGPEANLNRVTLIINADTDVPHGLVVKCIDYARDAGITRFAIATAPVSTAPTAAP